jgi:hypothetical protein
MQMVLQFGQVVCIILGCIYVVVISHIYHVKISMKPASPGTQVQARKIRHILTVPANHKALFIGSFRERFVRLGSADTRLEQIAEKEIDNVPR